MTGAHEPTPPKHAAAADVHVVAAEIVDASRRFLITQRMPHAVFPLLWEFPGGRVEPGEAPEDALARELRLRLGVQIRVGAVRATTTAALSDQRTLALTCYAATLAEGTRPTRQGVWDFRWVTLDAIGSYRFPPADAASLERLLEGR
jgi:8-oxo-dGTP diphosphatase